MLISGSFKQINVFLVLRCMPSGQYLQFMTLGWELDAGWRPVEQNV